MEPGEVIFENTFARACTNRKLTVDEIIEGMKFGAFNYDLLPIEVRDAVDRALEHEDALAAERGTHDPYYDSAWELDLLDVELEPVHITQSPPATDPPTETHTDNIVNKTPVHPGRIAALHPERWPLTPAMHTAMYTAMPQVMQQVLYVPTRKKNVRDC